MTIKQIFGINIGFFRNKKGESQLNMANDMNMSQRTISRIENGKENLKFSNLDLLVQYLKVPAYWLFLPEKINFRELFENEKLCQKEVETMYMFYLSKNQKNEDSREIVSYGIKMETDQKEELRIDEISEDKEFVEYLVNMCNNYQIPTEHFPEVIRDAMLEEQMNRINKCFKS